MNRDFQLKLLYDTDLEEFVVFELYHETDGLSHNTKVISVTSLEGNEIDVEDMEEYFYVLFDMNKIYQYVGKPQPESIELLKSIDKRLQRIEDKIG